MATTLCGVAYQRPATVEFDGQLVRWRAARGHVHPTPEAIDVALAELRGLSLVEVKTGRTTGIGVAFGASAILGVAYGQLAHAAAGLAVAIPLIGLRRWRPRWFLVFGTSGRAFTLRLAADSVAPARALLAEHESAAGALPLAIALRPDDTR